MSWGGRGGNVGEMCRVKKCVGVMGGRGGHDGVLGGPGRRAEARGKRLAESDKTALGNAIASCRWQPPLSRV